MRFRIALAFVLAAGLALAPGRTALAADVRPEAKTPKIKKNQAYVAPDFAAYGVTALALAPPSSIDHIEENEKLFGQAIENGFGNLEGYRFQGSSYFIDGVRKAGLTDQLAAIEKAALAGLPADSTSVAALRAQAQVQAILFGRLSTWQRFVVDPYARGQSFTQVGGDFALVSLKDGSLLWRGSFLEKGDGPYNDPNTAEVTERDVGGNSTARQAQLEPPSFREVLEKLLRRVTATVPKSSAPAAKPAP